MPGVRRAIFLDRDGVICVNRAEYIRSLEEVEFIPGSLDALARLASTRFTIVIVSNQAGVGRGLIPSPMADAIQRLVEERVRAAGGRIDGSYLCFHAPWDNCVCRKPKPGLLLRAADELNLDIGMSFMAGDALSDVQAGRAAGVLNSVLLLSGRGSDQARLTEAAELAPIDMYADLSEFTDHLLSVDTGW